MGENELPPGGPVVACADGDRDAQLVDRSSGTAVDAPGGIGGTGDEQVVDAPAELVGRVADIVEGQRGGGEAAPQGSALPQR